MLRFLRKFRKSLIGEGRLKTYFFYAIGEIFLVVVGILLALQINNWNLKRTNIKQERQYYQNIRMVPLSVENQKRLYSYPFQNNFDLLIGLMTEKKEIYEQAEEQINTIIALIQQELTP